jgi:plasmanylethanolamine desaturase
MTASTSAYPTRWLLGRYDYPVSHRVLEVASLGAFTALFVAIAGDVVGAFRGGLSWTTAVGSTMAVVLAFAVGDLLSGVVHFLFDQYGSPATPVIGQKFVKPFRDHHDDPMAMTHGDLIAVNSDNLLVCLPVLAVAVFAVDLPRHAVVGVFVLALVVGVALTNQFHKWAHMPEVPRMVRVAQRRGLILSVEHHHQHHLAPFDRHYCITFGRMDVLLDRLTRRR